MNEIEKKYFKAFKSYVETCPKIQTRNPEPYYDNLKPINKEVN